MDIEDVRGTKFARSAFTKRGIDITMADVRVTHGVCFVRGRLKAAPKTNIKNVETECLQIAGIIRRQANIKECVLDCTYQEPYFK
jgi:hypothetical protein